MSYLFIAIEDENGNSVEYKVTASFGLILDQLLTKANNGVLDRKEYGTLGKEEKEAEA